MDKERGWAGRKGDATEEPKENEIEDGEPPITVALVFPSIQSRREATYSTKAESQSRAREPSRDIWTDDFRETI